MDPTTSKSTTTTAGLDQFALQDAQSPAGERTDNEFIAAAGDYHEVWSKQYGRPYYVNMITKETTWIKPAAFANSGAAIPTVTAVPVVDYYVAPGMAPYNSAANSMFGPTPLSRSRNTYSYRGGAMVTQSFRRAHSAVTARIACDRCLRFTGGILCLVAAIMLSVVWGYHGPILVDQDCYCVYRSYSSSHGCSVECGPVKAGVSFAYAGYVEVAPTADISANSVVGWTDMNTENSCQPNTSIFVNYTLPNGLCTQSTPGGPYTYSLPSYIPALTGLMGSSCIFAWIAMLMGVLQRPRSHLIPAFGALLSATLIIAMCALFTTQPLMVAYQNQGAHIPLRTKVNQMIVASPNPVKLALASYFGVSVTAFILLVIAAMLFGCSHSLPSKKEEDAAAADAQNIARAAGQNV